MSSTDESFTRIGCPRCESTIDAPVPPGPGLRPPAIEGTTSLRGRETYCRNCGHELEVYYY